MNDSKEAADKICNIIAQFDTLEKSADDICLELNSSLNLTDVDLVIPQSLKTKLNLVIMPLFKIPDNKSNVHSALSVINNFLDKTNGVNIFAENPKHYPIIYNTCITDSIILMQKDQLNQYDKAVLSDCFDIIQHLLTLLCINDYAENFLCLEQHVFFFFENLNRTMKIVFFFVTSQLENEDMKSTLVKCVEFMATWLKMNYVVLTEEFTAILPSLSRFCIQEKCMDLLYPGIYLRLSKISNIIVQEHILTNMIMLIDKEEVTKLVVDLMGLYPNHRESIKKHPLFYRLKSSSVPNELFDTHGIKF